MQRKTGQILRCMCEMYMAAGGSPHSQLGSLLSDTAASHSSCTAGNGSAGAGMCVNGSGSGCCAGGTCTCSNSSTSTNNNKSSSSPHCIEDLSAWPTSPALSVPRGRSMSDAFWGNGAFSSSGGREFAGNLRLARLNSAGYSSGGEGGIGSSSASAPWQEPLDFSVFRCNTLPLLGVSDTKADGSESPAEEPRDCVMATDVDADPLINAAGASALKGAALEFPATAAEQPVAALSVLADTTGGFAAAADIKPELQHQFGGSERTGGGVLTRQSSLDWPLHIAEPPDLPEAAPLPLPVGEAGAAADGPAQPSGLKVAFHEPAAPAANSGAVSAPGQGA